MIAIVKEIDVQTNRGHKIGVVSFDTSDVMLDLSGRGVALSLHITREEAMALYAAIGDVVSAYDATVDRYHEQCDEPVAVEVR